MILYTLNTAGQLLRPSPILCMIYLSIYIQKCTTHPVLAYLSTPHSTSPYKPFKSSLSSNSFNISVKSCSPFASLISSIYFLYSLKNSPSFPASGIVMPASLAAIIGLKEIINNLLASALSSDSSTSPGLFPCFIQRQHLSYNSTTIHTQPSPPHTRGPWYIHTRGCCVEMTGENTHLVLPLLLTHLPL